MVHSFDDMRYGARILRECGVKPEIECYDVGMISNALFLRDIGALDDPIYFDFVLGVLGQIPATVENVIRMYHSLPSGAPWSVCAVGLSEWPMITTAILLGGNVRVGFEDNIYLSRGVRAKSNAEMVEKAVRIACELDREIASPEEARAMLKLPPRETGPEPWAGREGTVMSEGNGASKARKRVAVIGAGLMGHGIAQAFAENGCSVALYDVADGVLEGAFNRVRSNLKLLVETGIENGDYVEEVLSRIRMTKDLADAVGDVQFVTEAIPEDVNLKLDVFRLIDAATDEETVLASNTSTLSLTGIAKSIKKGDRLIVTHWFNPPHLMPVVEVVKTELTSEVTFQRTFQLLKDIGKDPVHVLKQIPGFLVNRIQTAMFREVVALLEEGVASAEDIDKAVRGSFGLRLAVMGPLTVADFGGVDLWYKGAQNLYPSLDASKEPGRLWTEMVEKGFLGEKTGRGFFEYRPQTIQEIVKQRDIKLLALLKILYPAKAKENDDGDPDYRRIGLHRVGADKGIPETWREGCCFRQGY